MALAHQDIIDQLTLEEKASLLSGANFWNTKSVDQLNIPSIMLTDGPHGLRKQGGKSDHLGLNASLPATCFPTASALAASWDTGLVERVGTAIGREAAAEKVSVLLGPGLNIVRNPLGGRTFEYFSEDPYLTGTLATSMTRGIQATGVAACPKHFAVNSQEHLRMSIDEVVDDRALHELYLEGFRRVVTESKPRAIMSSYNKVNGTYANEHIYLLHDTLRERWGFDGVVVTDWGGEHDRIAGLRAGNQLEMPSTGGVTDHEIVEAVRHGVLEEMLVDDRVNDILQLVFDAQPALAQTSPADFDAHHELATEAARRSLVLLKNDASTLPLAPHERVAIIGDFATTPRYQGAGSSLINPTRVENTYHHLQQSDLSIVGVAQGFKRFGGASRRLTHQALTIASKADTIVLFLGLDEASEAEGIDRAHMRLPDNQLALVDTLAALGKKLVVVLAGGSPVELPFADTVDAILLSHLAGQGGGRAVAECLVGTTNPSGKLAVSWPLRYEDTPSAAYYPGPETSAEHRESTYVGYRYYDTTNRAVCYPFGHGLSYTSFAYTDLTATPAGLSVTVTNTGTTPGEEIVQAYVQAPRGPIFRPQQELKGFSKVPLAPGESKTIAIPFDDHTFAHYDPTASQWRTMAGTYTIAVGGSSRDIRLTATLTVAGEQIEQPAVESQLPTYYSGEVATISSQEFEVLLGRPLPPVAWDRTTPLTPHDTFRQLHYSNAIGKLIYGTLILARRILFAIGKPLAANNIMFVVDMPFYKLTRFSGGKITAKQIRRFLRLIWLGKKRG